MKDKTSRLKVLRIRGTATERKHDLVVKERPVTIFLNDVDIGTLLCSPSDLDFLAAGFLFAEGLIRGKEDIKRIIADRRDGVVWVETVGGKKPPHSIITRRLVTSGCGKGLSFADIRKDPKRMSAGLGFTMPSSSVALLKREFQTTSEVFKRTGGVHSAALADLNRLVFFNEDIGRHNAIDKVIGECILGGTSTEGLIMITSGRISSDILAKAARAGTPVIISKSAATDLAVKLARDLGITLIGFARGSRMNIYSNEWRISLKPNARSESVARRTSPTRRASDLPRRARTNRRNRPKS